MNKVQPQDKKTVNESSGLIPKDELKAIINDGNVKKLVGWAEKIGQYLSRELTTSQVRNFFNAVRRIESDIDEERRKCSAGENARLPDNAYRQLMLLKPKLAYQSERTGAGVKKLSKVLNPAIDLIERDIARFKNFVDFFEAILAYHKAAGECKSSGKGNF